MPTAEYTVAGMTCGSCAAVLSMEVGEVPGVNGVRVDPDTGRMTVSSDGEVDDEAVRAAVAAAGYEVASG